MSGNEIGVNYFSSLALERKRFPVITLNARVIAAYSLCRVCKQRKIPTMPRSRYEPRKSNSIMCLFGGGGATQQQ